MTTFRNNWHTTWTYYLIILVEVFVITYIWTPKIITLEYKRLSFQETHSEDLREFLTILRNEHELIGLPELRNGLEDNVTIHEMPRGNESYQFVNITNIVKNLTSPVLLTVTNYGFLDLLLNLLYSIQRLSMQLTILVVCEDETAYAELLKRQNNLTLKFHLVLNYVQESIANAADYKTEPYITLVQRRVSYIELLIQSGLDVFNVDSDIVLLENPFKYFIGNNYDIFAQGEVEGARVACSGFFYLRANYKTKKFMRTWRRGLVRDSKGNQFAFNRKLKLFRPPMKVKILPWDRFMCGKIFLKSEKPWFERSPLPVEVHANFMVGEGKKADMLKAYQLWFVPD